MSTKQDTHRRAIRPLLLAALNSPGLLSPSEFTMARFSLDTRLRAHLLDPDISALEDYLIDHSDLPGRRANLEMIAAFADEVGTLCTAPDVSLFHSYVAMDWLLQRLLNRYPPSLFGSDPDSPLQMPQLCGAVALGEWAAANCHIEAGVAGVLDLADSPLWRVREGVALGLQRLLYHDWHSTTRRMERRALDANAYEWRGLIAGIAEPALLQEPDHALDALDLHSRALTYLRRLPADTRWADSVRTLRKALGYTVSVVVAAAPEAGFPQMHAWAAWNDPDVQWIIRENLKKKRLNTWPDQIDSLRNLL
jgi:hypothetical protein